MFSLLEAKGAIGLGVGAGLGVGRVVGFGVGFGVAIFSSSVSSQAFPTMKHLRPLWQMPSGQVNPFLPQLRRASY